ncbi:hypothetical protein Fcan01_04057 [Folsomia candida]|uniref:C2H2-type domain-containing protein n=1 Tax=Folsomia candida TaxID=158441 RepID=A0A226EVY7_FOLCA|nr:hypothetical protein Fcan01_04057 [Folsomia candida]
METDTNTHLDEELEEDKLWEDFLQTFQRQELTLYSDDEGDEEFECEYSSSSGSESSANSSDGDEGESGDTGSDSYGSECSDDLPGTFPYMDSDSDDDSDPDDQDTIAYSSWVNGLNGFAPEVQVITLDDDSEDDIAGEMRCLRCPDGPASVYKDKNLFLLHRERHKGKNHFVCPTCLKPFIQISYCFAHEIRLHNLELNSLQNPVLFEANRYRAMKLEWELEQEKIAQAEGGNLKSPTSKCKVEKAPATFEDDADFFTQIDSPDDGTASPPPPKITKDTDIIKTPYCTNFTGLVLYPEEGEYETDDDDPKFYPDHAVPSTALYPYRGVEPLSIYDCYEIHLRFGRKKRTAASTIARCAMARRFWKPPKFNRPPGSTNGHSNSTAITAGGRAPRKRGRGSLIHLNSEASSSITGTSSTVINGSRKRKQRSPIENGIDKVKKRPPIAKKTMQETRRKKKPLVVSKKLAPVDVKGRTFVAGIIARTCLICGFLWTSEAELKAHRDELHPKKTVLELMTLTKNPTKYDYKEKSDPVLDESNATKKRCRLQNEAKQIKSIPIPLPSPKEDFLSNLGLITKEQRVYLESLPKPIRGKLCYVTMIDLPEDIISELMCDGKVYTCPKSNCDFYAKTRNIVKLHVRSKHRAWALRNNVEL